MDKIYDVIIIGSGPAGMTAAIYARRFNLNVLVIEYNAPGGAMVNTSEIANYPGFSAINGVDLSMNMYNQMMELDVSYQAVKVDKIIKNKEKDFTIYSQNQEFYGKSVIIATGTRNKILGLESEKKFFYRGISWCAICDGPLYKGKDVAVIGGGNSAIGAALSLTNFVNKVYLIHRRNEFRSEKISIDKVKSNPKIELVLNSNVKEFLGKETLEGITVEKDNSLVNLAVQACFEEIGRIPNTEFIELIDKTNDGYIKVDEDFMTNVEGIFACGDVVDKKIRQIATAVNDGAIAGLAVSKYLN